MEALVDAMGGELRSIKVTGPLGELIESVYGIVKGRRKTGIIEIASAAGLTLVPAEKRNPLLATSYGVGELIKDAIMQGCRHFIVGIGGSAVNDGGIGMLQALGFGLLDKNGQQVSFGAQGLSELASITMEHVIPELSECTFRVACDVTNPLCGESGASMVYGPQKEATPEMARKMDAWMAAYAKLTAKAFGESGLAIQTRKTGICVDSNYPGSGAAGGLGFAFRTFLHAELESGVKIILEETHLEDYIRDADLVVTGEGRLDAQTVMGKAPIGVAQLAKKYGKTVIAFCGCASDDAKACNGAGIDAYFPVVRGPQTLEEAMRPEVAKNNIEETSEQVVKVIVLPSHFLR